MIGSHPQLKAGAPQPFSTSTIHFQDISLITFNVHISSTPTFTINQSNMATSGPLPDPSKHPPHVTVHDTPALLAVDSAPASSQVSWQTAYWTLIPLAVNTMAQPSGRILSLPAKYRTYLRCSPLICAADCLSIFIHLALYFSSFPPKDAIRLLTTERFGDNEKAAEGIQAIEKLTFIRWLFFVFGTLGPGVKLMAMEGVPWTKAWGAMFLLSFLIVEALVVLSWIYGPHEPVPESHAEDMLLHFKSKLEKADMGLLVGSGLSYAWVLAWVVTDIHNSSVHQPMGVSSARLPFWFTPFQTLLDIQIIVLVLLILPVFVSLVIIVVWLINCFFHQFFNPNSSGKCENFVVCFYFLFVLATFSFGGFFSAVLFMDSLITWGFFTVLVCPGLIVYGFLQSYAERWPRLAGSVFITWESEAEVRGMDRDVTGDPPDLTLLCFMMFLYTMILCVIWYWYRYNPEGTVNREWTGVFG
jgi:hypothetical protein